MNANTAPAAKTAVTNVPCACSGFAAVTENGTVTRTGCTATTKRTFAPGHDARLKGFLIRAGVEGLLIRTPEGGADQVADKVADRFGFGGMVRDGIERGAKKAFERTLRATVKSAKKSHETPKKVTARIGRWTYEGTVTDSPEWGPQFTYTNRKGVQLTTTTFTRV